MATTIIKSGNSDNQAFVDSTGHLLVTGTFTPAPGTSDVNLLQVGGVAITLGQKTMTASVPVVFASDQSALTITGNTTVSGTVNTNLNGLPTWQTSSYTVGTSAVQLASTPLTGRSSMSVKVVCTGSNTVFVGNSSSVITTGPGTLTGYILFNGDSVQLDITSAANVWAIATGAGQTAYVLETGG